MMRVAFSSNSGSALRFQERVRWKVKFFSRRPPCANHLAAFLADPRLGANDPVHDGAGDEMHEHEDEHRDA